MPDPLRTPFRRGLLAGLAVLALAAACAGDDTPDRVDDTAADDPEEEAPGLDPAVPGETTAAGAVTAATVEPSTLSSLAAELVVDADRPVHLAGTARAGDRTVSLPRTAVAATAQRYPVVGLRADTEYEIEMTATAEDGSDVGTVTSSLRTGSLPDGMPAFDVTSEPARMAPGLTMFDIGQWGVEGSGRSSPYLVIMDEEGEVVWYWESFFTVGDTRQLDSGRILMNYPDFGAREIGVLGETLVAWETIPDEDPPPGGDAPRAIRPPRGDRPYSGLHHEVGPLPNGNLLALTRRAVDVPAAERRTLCPSDQGEGDDEEWRLRADYVVEFERDGTVVREWPLADVIDPADVPGTDLCVPGPKRDWAHANGAVLDPERNAIIVTARHIDMLFAFRYQDDERGPSGELLWSIGPGGTLPVDNGDVTYHPHAPEVLPGGDILVYDNGNGRPGTAPDDPTNATYSRAVRYAVDDSADDPAQWTARQVWEHRTDDRDGTPLYADFLGDADLLVNGNVLIGHGGIGQAVPPARGRIIEVVPTGDAGGDVVFDVWLPDTWVSYRAERIPSLYVGPDWSPS